MSRPSQMKKLSDVSAGQGSFDAGLVPGSIVEHGKFGRGEVLTVEGDGGSRKAEIRFESGDTKKLLLQFAKLKIIA